MGLDEAWRKCENEGEIWFSLSFLSLSLSSLPILPLYFISTKLCGYLTWKIFASLTLCRCIELMRAEEEIFKRQPWSAGVLTWKILVQHCRRSRVRLPYLIAKLLSVYKGVSDDWLLLNCISRCWLVLISCFCCGLGRYFIEYWSSFCSATP